MMNRYTKTYEQPGRPSSVAPHSSKLTIDLMGLELNEKQIDQIRSEAVKSAVQSLKSIAQGKQGQDFATFSTFSTFGSGG
jgi:hypothetical protein